METGGYIVAGLGSQLVFFFFVIAYAVVYWICSRLVFFLKLYSLAIKELFNVFVFFLFPTSYEHVGVF